MVLIRLLDFLFVCCVFVYFRFERFCVSHLFHVKIAERDYHPFFRGASL